MSRFAEAALAGEAIVLPPSIAEQERMVEALLFAAPAPMTLRDMVRRMPQGCDPAAALANLRGHYASRGIRIVRVGEGWALRTAPDLGFLLRDERVEQKKLSRAAIETLAIIAYHQPVTRAEIEEIRGVAVSRGTVDQLLDLGWVRFGRRRVAPGRPVTFIVTEAFLDQFGLENARDLPGLKDLRAAGLLDNRALPDAGEGREDTSEDTSQDMSEDAASEAAQTTLPLA